MLPHDLYKRLASLMDAEFNVTYREFAMSKRSANFCNKLDRIKKTAKQQRETLNSVQLQCEQLESEIQLLAKFKKELLAHLKKLKADFKSKVAECEADRIEQRRRELNLMDSLHTLKEVTGTYINYNALPERVQGVVLCQKANKIVWKPFNIDPRLCTQKEVQAHIWGETQLRSPYQDEWRRLLFGTQPLEECNVENIAAVDHS